MSALHRAWLAERADGVQRVHMLVVQCTDRLNADALAAADAINACLESTASGCWTCGDAAAQAAAWDAVIEQIDACAAHVRVFLKVHVHLEEVEE